VSRLSVLIALVLAALALVAAGCGDNDDDGSDEETTEQSATTGGGFSTEGGGVKGALLNTSIALEVYATDNNGNYSGATLEDLQDIEPAVPDDVTIETTDTGYTVSATDDDVEYVLERDESGATTKTCDPPGEGDCPDSGEW
jgi:hypothetical protein